MSCAASMVEQQINVQVKSTGLTIFQVLRAGENNCGANGGRGVATPSTENFSFFLNVKTRIFVDSEVLNWLRFT